MKFVFYLVLIFAFSIAVAAQDRQSPDNQPHITPRNQPGAGNQSQPADEEQPNVPKGESSSKDAQINLAKAGVACVTCDEPRKGVGTLVWLVAPEWLS